MRRRSELLLAALAVAAFLGLCASLDRVWSGTVGVSDTPVYERYGERMARGDIPYRDFRVEYPPGALPAFVLPAVVADGPVGYARAFAVLMAACGALAVAFAAAALSAVGASAGRRVAALGLVASSPLLLGGLLLTRFDLFPAALTVAALAALVAGRDRLGAGVLGAAVAVKLYPAVLVPLLLAWVWRRRGPRAAAGAGLLCVGVAAAVFAPFLVVAPDGVLWGIGRQLGRPLQIESLGAAILLALHHAAGMPLGWASSHGSQNLTGTGAAVAAVLTSLAQLAVLAWLWWRFARGPATGERLLRFGAAAVVAFVALGKVLSPQFLVWLVPLVPLAAGGAGAVAGALLALACLLTRGWFPDRYWELVKEFDPTASWLVVARDLTLVALLAALALPFAGLRARARGRARSPSPARSPRRT